jgi:hypothetical protein
MNEAGEFRLCSGCADWAIWTPVRRKGPVYCCEMCARGQRCVCAAEVDDRTSIAWSRGSVYRRGNHGIHEEVHREAARSRRA